MIVATSFQNASLPISCFTSRVLQMRLTPSSARQPVASHIMSTKKSLTQTFNLSRCLCVFSRQTLCQVFPHCFYVKFLREMFCFIRAWTTICNLGTLPCKPMETRLDARFEHESARSEISHSSFMTKCDIMSRGYMIIESFGNLLQFFLLLGFTRLKGRV